MPNLIACASCSKIAKYWREKAKRFFWRQMSLKEVKFVKFAFKKANLATLGSRGGLHPLFICWPVSDGNNSSASEAKIPPCQHTWFWMAWSFGLCMPWYTGSRKTPNIATLIRDTALIGFNPPLRALYLVHSGLPLLCSKTLRSYVWTVVVVTLVCFCRSNIRPGHSQWREIATSGSWLRF